jgi:hypothetical protein
MAQNVRIAGATYPSVPTIVVPLAGGGDAAFIDPSPTTATPAMVDSGAAFFDAQGQLQQGTGRVNLWENGDVEITGSSGVRSVALSQELPAGRYTMIATTETTWTGDARITCSLHTVSSGMSQNNRLCFVVFEKNTTSSFTFVITDTAKGMMLEAADNSSHSAGQTATYSNIFLIREPLIDMEAVTGVVPTEASQTIQPSPGNAGLSSVQIDGIPSTYIGSGVKRVQTHIGTGSAHSTAYTATAVTLTVAKTGTYNVSWDAWRTTTSGTSGSKLYINGTGYGDAVTTWDIGSYGHHVELSGLSLTAGDVLVVRVRANNTSNYVYCGNLIIQEV